MEQNSLILIRGLEVKACHGVLGFEKTQPQPFIFDADMLFDFYGAYKSDDVTDTVNYAPACELITQTAQKHGFNLIEKLAYECAFVLAEAFALKGVKITVYKPKAPVNVKFSNVGVTVTLLRTTAYLSIGSSEGDKKARLDEAVEKLGKTRGISVKKVSSYIKTPPYGGVAKGEFLNCAAEIETLLAPHALLDEIHRIESECGRVRKERWGDRTLDIDIVFYGRQIISDSRLTVPHPDYRNRWFVLAPMREIAPDFVCPECNICIKDIKCD